ncbi:kinesin family protein [Diplodia corticola]|uniref:Kinesin family protein n=1 Tax=Diplodia corticola TaxID=236234 RepID=A0A1J9SG71_9PEZI|nr:kinesin family protein [Diplodia corticola]OJD38581.1 kinesin family protein [Diplodia corticola]
MEITSPPGSPASGIQRPLSAMMRPNRSSSRMSVSSRAGGGSRASDEDSKTAVKVAIRVRPPLKPGDPNYELIPQRFRNSACQVNTDTTIAVDSQQGKKLFVFDRVFGESVDQAGVWEYLSESVNAFVQGYNVSILAYGQSGAGKSYTMGTSGPQQQANEEAMGVVPRAARLLFEVLTGHSAPGAPGSSGLRAPTRYSTMGLPGAGAKPAEKNWQLKASYVEIYNEQLRDLLVPADVPQYERAQVTIREDPKGRIILSGLQQMTINSIDDLLHALNFGSSIRQTDATAINSQSSRSHAVFSLNLVQKKSKSATGQLSVQDKRRSMPLEAMSGSDSWVTVDSKLHFVDLAGSERLKNTGAEGARAREGISINAGLASLGKVISQLSQRSGSHVSYRDSKLTRLLQDSLGGNAITYMVACVNPAEFHLSETLNTVQYAQRARAIQSKPQIQQSADEGDAKAIIERLRAEVSFLRDQIRLSERTGRKESTPKERAERSGEREIELQNQLLDIQENYNALSQRHANFIAEFTKARDADSSDASGLSDALGETAMERLNRSNSFAEAVQQVVMEYEKTIQSLEGSLSTTRSSLSTSESSLLEKETKIAYMESLNQQLQTRIQKYADREASNESYLKDLESKVDGITSGEEKQTAIIQDLRKEINRARENEQNCEEYISTLEERLAEAEQDHELMQREIERLEHVIERQRSIGKLDNLLYELDNINKENRPAEHALTNGHAKRTINGNIEEETEAEVEHEVERSGSPSAASSEPQTPDKIKETTVEVAPSTEEMPQSPEQTNFVNDKLEAVTQELFDLRVEHETTVHDFDDLQRKYQAALNTLSELQEAVDEARTSDQRTSISSAGPDSFLAHAGVNGINEIKEDGQPSSSRTLSSELSLLGESSNPRDSIYTSATSDAETALKGSEAEVAEEESVVPHDDALAQEMEKLKKLHEEKEGNMAELAQRYSQLEKDHQETLKYVDELKGEVQKAVQLARPDSPTAHVIRRKSSQNIVAVDRANRSFTALRNIALDHLEEDPETIQAFEMNLNTIMTDLHTAKERVVALETDMAQVRREMEGKMTIISGLTRERSSLKSSPLDITAVAQMRDQLMESEAQVRQMQESHSAREQELVEQIESLRTALGSPRSPSIRISNSGDATESSQDMPGDFPESPGPGLSPMVSRDDLSQDEATQQIAVLQREVVQWQTKYDSTITSMRASENELQVTIKELEEALRIAEQRIGQSDAAVADVESLKKEIDSHKAAAAASAARLEELEESHAKILHQVESETGDKELTERELNTHRGLVANLERQLEEHKAAVALHQQGLDTLRETHAEEIEQINSRLETQLAEHQEAAAALQEQILKLQTEHDAEMEKSRQGMVTLVQSISAALNEDTDATNVQSQIEKLIHERKELLEKHDAAATELAAAREELEKARAAVADMEGKVGELKMINEETLKELEKISDKERKSSRLVEELEDQLNSNYDSHQAANNRLSALQIERQVQLEEAVTAKGDMEKELEDSRKKIAELEAQLGGAKRFSNRESLDPHSALQRSDSKDSVNLRKSASHTSLPSPPPAIPLPPLPGSPPASAGPNAIPSSPPASRHQSKDIAQAQLVEDQEARIRTIEKHLFAEKQLTATLEEALTDLEASSTKVKNEMETWKKKCTGLEEEINVMKQEQSKNRYSLQAVEEERNARMRVEAERAHLEARMAALNQANKKKKKSALNCF